MRSDPDPIIDGHPYGLHTGYAKKTEKGEIVVICEICGEVYYE